MIPRRTVPDMTNPNRTQHKPSAVVQGTRKEKVGKSFLPGLPCVPTRASVIFSPGEWWLLLVVGVRVGGNLLHDPTVARATEQSRAEIGKKKRKKGHLLLISCFSCRTCMLLWRFWDYSVARLWRWRKFDRNRFRGMKQERDEVHCRNTVHCSRVSLRKARYWHSMQSLE